MKDMLRMVQTPRWCYLPKKVTFWVVGVGILVWPALAQAESRTLQPTKTTTAARVETGAVEIHIVEDTPEHIVIDYELGDFTQTSILIEGQEYTDLTLGKEALIKDVVGAPQLPLVSRSIIIPDDAKMEVQVLESDYYEIENINVASSKGFLLRTVNPADVLYTFGEVYDIDDYYPGELVTLSDAYILRDQRGLVVKLYPFQYNPVAGILRVYTNITVEVFKTGPAQINVLQQQERGLSLAFHQIYLHHFLNYDMGLRYTPLDEDGEMLIICHDPWLSNVQPLVDHKNTAGITTTPVGVSTIGNNATSIKNYIQSIYNSSDLAFVLLVGDGAQVDTPYASGGSADPTYALLAGGDSYPDILVGRFSAETAAQVDTQVLRTVEYEQLPATSQSWFMKGTGIASDEGPGHYGEYDYVHMGYIRNDLLAYGYTEVDEIYEPYATTAMISAALNAGRGIINYCGHGSTTSWGTTGFSNYHVNALTNDNMLPFIFDVACVNGQFDGPTCFAEAWLRATNGSEPTGAIGIYASSINQYWDPPMTAQDESVDLLVAETYFSYGALCFAGSCKMMDDYGSSGVDMYNTWHVFGDPSLRVFGQPCTTNGDCDDGEFCNGEEICVDGVCQPGTPVDCDDGVSCTYDRCNKYTNSCDYIPGNNLCDDGLFCNGAETCDPLNDCQPGADPCPGEDCDEVNDVCIPIGCDNDGICETGEDCNNCPGDCITGGAAVCGNGVCEIAAGEDCISCPQDCNGKQNGKPSRRFCCGDGDGQNPVDCSDSRCYTGGWECSSALPMPSCCGDGVCLGIEDECNCEVDCGAPSASEIDCSDGIDNDCDGSTDCEDGDCNADPACEGCIATHSKEKGPRCSDGIDNDCDGLIDGADPDCQGGV